jgi:hypothetical protein
LYSLSPRKPKKAFTTNRLLFIPSALADLPQFLSALGKDSRFIHDHQDKLAYILHKIHEGKGFDSCITSAGYVNLSQEVLAQVIGKRYVSPMLALLLDAGVIETDGCYMEGEKALGYRVADAYRSPAIGILIFNQEVLGRKLALHAKKRKTEAKHNTLVKNIYADIRALRIRYTAACHYNRSVYEQTESFLRDHESELLTYSFSKQHYQALLDWATVVGKVHLPSAPDLRKAMRVRKDRTAFQVLIDANLDAFAANLISIEKINSKDFHPPKRPVDGSRIYTNLTNLSSDLRQFLYHAKHAETTLYNIDIKNSQPFLIGILLRKTFQGELPIDAKQYIADTSSGVFYERLAGLMGTPLSTVNGNDSELVKSQKQRERKEFKQSFFSTVFFCENRHTEGSKPWSVFEGEYPTVAGLIREHKQHDYRALANLMQHTEAQIILEKVVRRLHKSKVWCASIHDSIVCLAPDRETVKAAMLTSFQVEFNLAPTLNEEPLRKPE